MVEIKLSREPLAAEEINPFLSFLFKDVATRPQTLKLRETAAVARYLVLLACNAVPQDVVRCGHEAIKAYKKKQRTESEREARTSAAGIADHLWRLLASYGEFEQSTRGQAIAFLKTHANTYLANCPSLVTTIELVEGYSLPPGLRSPFKAPALLSDFLNVQGPDPTPYITTDLSERIYAADHALKRAGQKKHHVRIANAMNRFKVRRVQRKKQSHDGWVPQDVNERVKEYERRFQNQLGRNLRCTSIDELHRTLSKQSRTLEDEIQKLRITLVDKWVTMFRTKFQLDLLWSAD
jgi:hypothetical protein